jgi:hypothetical protein
LRCDHELKGPQLRNAIADRMLTRTDNESSDATHDKARACRRGHRYGPRAEAVLASVGLSCSAIAAAISRNDRADARAPWRRPERHRCSRGRDDR